MADFRPSSASIAEFIVQPGAGFYIPEYQREFSWGRENIARLFEDVAFSIDDLTATRKFLTFLGTFITVASEEGVYPKGRLPTKTVQVVDGQQRLTTIMIVACELRHSLDAALGQTQTSWLRDVAAQLRSRLEQIYLLDMGERGKPPYRPWPRLVRSGDRWGYDEKDADYRSAISRYLFARGVQKKEPQTEDPEFASAIRSVKDEVKRIQNGESESDQFNGIDDTWEKNIDLRIELLGEDGSLDAADDAGCLRLAVFSRILLDQVRVIHVAAPDEDSAFALFEPLNTTGQSLTPLETLKPLIVQAEGGGEKYSLSPSQRFYATAAAHARFDDPNRKAKATADLVTVFALAETGDKLPHRQDLQRQYLRREFDFLGREPGGLPFQRRFLSTLADVAKFSGDVWQENNLPGLPSTDEETRVCLLFLRDSNHNVVRGLLARYWAAENVEEFAAAVRATAGFWLLWRLSRSTTGNIDSHYRRLMKERWEVGNVAHGPFCRRCKYTENPLPGSEALKESLRAILKVKGGIGDRSAWILKVADRQFDLSQAVLRFALLVAHHDSVPAPENDALIKSGVKGCSPTITVAQWNADYTIEHIAPQTPTGADKGYDEAIYSESLQYRLGNLTLVPKAENASLGNRNWLEKRRIYAILGERDQDTRRQLMEEAGVDLQESTKKLLETSVCLPFCEAIGAVESDTWSADTIRSRSKALAERIWWLVAPWLGFER